MDLTWEDLSGADRTGADGNLNVGYLAGVARTLDVGPKLDLEGWVVCVKAER